MTSRSKWVYAITLVAFSIGLFGLLASCANGLSGGGGTITIRLTGAGDLSGKPFLGGVVYAGTSEVVGLNLEYITAGGTLEIMMLDTATMTTPVIFTNGVSYGVLGTIDTDENFGVSSGDYIPTQLKYVEVAGDMVVEFVFPQDFTIVP